MSLFRFFKVGLLGLLLPSAAALGQFNPLRQAEKKMTQGDWISARQILSKALRKDTLNVQAEFTLCRWFLNPNNPARQTDSAYLRNLRALHDFQKSSVKQKEKLRRDGIDSATVVRLRIRIDSLAFEEAKQINSEKGYHYFLQMHLFAKERVAAIELRDEVAFVNVLRLNTYTAFDDYMK